MRTAAVAARWQPCGSQCEQPEGFPRAGCKRMPAVWPSGVSVCRRGWWWWWWCVCVCGGVWV
eukprot:7384994-Prymnesium_polylepis.1